MTRRGAMDDGFDPRVAATRYKQIDAHKVTATCAV